MNQVLAQSKSFVVSVRSASEAPVIGVARQAVAVVGQELRLPIFVRDLDQDALAFAAQGLPAGARIVTEPQYGRATIVWTPSAAQAACSTSAWPSSKRACHQDSWRRPPKPISCD